jgi:hypothetical protein
MKSLIMTKIKTLLIVGIVANIEKSKDKNS